MRGTHPTMSIEIIAMISLKYVISDIFIKLDFSDYYKP
jgi:hypothetical protein